MYANVLFVTYGPSIRCNRWPTNIQSISPLFSPSFLAFE